MESPEAQSPNRLAAEVAADGIALQLQGFAPAEVDTVVERPHCLIYLVGFCMGVTEVFNRQLDQEVDAARVSEGAIIWAFAGRQLENYDRGNNISIDASDLFMRMELGPEEELRPIYLLGEREGQAYASDNISPHWLATFIRDGLQYEQNR